jgi:hypothetical protein
VSEPHPDFYGEADVSSQSRTCEMRKSGPGKFKFEVNQILNNADYDNNTKLKLIMNLRNRRDDWDTDNKLPQVDSFRSRTALDQR